MHTFWVILSWALCGLIVGLIARLLVPGRHPLGFLMTMVLGIVGAFVGGLIYWLFKGTPGEPFSFSANAWHGWLLSILGAVVVLLGYTALQRRRSG